MTLRTTRRQTTKKLAGCELPSCFQLATVAAAINAQDRSTVAAKASRRRLLDKATKLTSATTETEKE